MSRATRWARLHLTGNRQRHRNWLNRRALQRGRTPLPDRLARPFSSLPVYRNRINPATGRPRRDDKALGRTADAELARMKGRWPQRPGPVAAWCGEVRRGWTEGSQRAAVAKAEYAATKTRLGQVQQRVRGRSR